MFEKDHKSKNEYNPRFPQSYGHMGNSTELDSVFVKHSKPYTTHHLDRRTGVSHANLTTFLEKENSVKSHGYLLYQ